MEASAEGQHPASVRPGKVVLIVDDDDEIREVLDLALQTAHHATAVACDGQQALSWLREHPSPCLILLDLMMPTMNGWELLEQLRGDERFSGVPVVVTTAFDRDLGCAAQLPILRKPIDLDNLLEVVHRYCGGRAP